MEGNEKFFGFDVNQILQVFRTSGDQVDSNQKICDKPTLSQLVEASEKLLEENADFLRKIYKNNKNMQ